MPPVTKFYEFDVYKIARKLASAIFNITKQFPPEEKYSLTDQIMHSSRSVQANFAEGFGKRIYPEVFKKHLIDALGSLEETRSWLISSVDCNYISKEDCKKLFNEYYDLGGIFFAS